MPGFLESTLHQGYGYLDPYVEKARNRVPLVDQAAKKAEEIVPPLILRADELAEPRIEKMRPYVEPKIEQVKEVVAPYVDGGVKYYNAGLEKVEQIKEFKDAKTTQIKDFKEAKTTQIKDYTEAKVERLTAVISSRKERAQKLLRVPGSEDLGALDRTTFLGKVALAFEKAEALVDNYFPLTEEQKLDYEDSDASSTADSDSSYVRINRSVSSIRYRLLLGGIVKVRMLLTLPLMIQTACLDGTAKEKTCQRVSNLKAALLSKALYVKSQVQEVFVFLQQKLATLSSRAPKSVLLKFKDEAKVMLDTTLEKTTTKVNELTQTNLFKKALQMVVSSSEKVLGKEKTEVLQTRVEERIRSFKLHLS
jgi:coenzyme F420-reducing hydrogenase alpha subunit